MSFILVLIAVLVAGCSKLQHLDELLTLKSVADSQSDMAKYVEKENKRFDELVAVYKDGQLERYDTKGKVRWKFGEPIFKKPEVVDGKDCETWMYRHSTEFFGSPKLYLSFDKDDKLVSWRYVEGEDPS